MAEMFNIKSADHEACQKADAVLFAQQAECKDTETR